MKVYYFPHESAKNKDMTNNKLSRDVLSLCPTNEETDKKNGTWCKTDPAYEANFNLII